MALNLAARLAEIDRRYAWHARQRQNRKAPLTITTLRISELERIYRHRFGGRFPNNKDGLNALTVMAEHFIQRSAPEMVVGWIQARAPWVDGITAAAITGDAMERTSRQTAAQLGWRIKLTSDERAMLRIRTIRAAGQTDEDIAADRKERDRERKAAERRAAGCKTRADYEAESLSQTRPWERFGISRRTWERRGKPMPQGSVASPTPIKREKIFTRERPATDAKEVAPTALYRAQARSDEKRDFRGFEPIGQKSTEPYDGKQSIKAQILEFPVKEHFKIATTINRRGRTVFKLCHVGPWGDLVVAECRSQAEAERALTLWLEMYPDHAVVRA